jgi:hypothetical protein
MIKLQRENLFKVSEEKELEPLFSIQGQLLKKANNFFKGWLPKHVVL